MKVRNYSARSNLPGKQRAAALKCPTNVKAKTLMQGEVKIMKRLQECQCIGYTDVPKLYDVKQSPKSSYIAMELVGNTLHSLRKVHKFGPKTIAMLAIQILSSIEALHSYGVIHRDMKPDNLAISLETGDRKIFLIDFTVSTDYLLSGVHTSYQENVPFVGSIEFCSNTAMSGIRQSRRDDLESIGYVLIYLLKGRLPWMTAGSNFQKICMKASTALEDLCEGLDPEFYQYFTYCQGLSFQGKPDYERLKRLFFNMAKRHGFTGLWDYPWVFGNSDLTVKDSGHPRRKSTSSKRDVSNMMQNLNNSRHKSPGTKLISLSSQNPTDVSQVSTLVCSPDFQVTTVKAWKARITLSSMTLSAFEDKEDPTSLWADEGKVRRVRSTLKNMDPLHYT